MPLCDSSGMCMRAVRPKPSPAVLRPSSVAGIPEVSRFSCMKFLGVSGVFDYAGLNKDSRYRPCSCCLPRILTASASGLYVFAAQSPTPPIPQRRPLSDARRRSLLSKMHVTAANLPHGGEKMEAQSRQRLDYEQIAFFIYVLAVLVALSVWFLAVRSPLWLDETVSYWSIAGGFRQIWARSVEANSFPAYFYILWFTNAVLGGNEIVLRIPSILAMLAATY